MRSAIRSVASIAALCLVATMALAVVAQADTIQVTAGSLEMIGTSGRLSIAGDRGFTLQAGVDVTGGIFSPWSACSVPECGPGSTIPLFAFWSGNDLPGVATLDGSAYGGLGSPNGVAFAVAQFSGQAVAPAIGLASTAVITAPFGFEGLFVQPIDPFTGLQHDLSGSGTATLWLEKNFDGTTWRTARALYQFEPVVTPEPATLLLVGSGLALAVARRRRSRQRNVSSAAPR